MLRTKIGSVNPSRCRFFFLILSAAILAPAAADTLLVPLTPRPLLLVSSESPLTRIVGPASRFSTLPALEGALDSLGFFSRNLDSAAQTPVYATGPRTTISSLLILGPGPDLGSLTRAFRTPCPYDAGRINALSSRALEVYADAGHPFAAATLEPVPDSLGDRLRITMRIEPGRPTVFGAILLPESTITRAIVLERDIPLRRGMAFSASRVRAAEARLRLRPNIISATAAAPRIRPAREAGHPDTAALFFDIRDRSGMGVDGALGYSSEAANGLIGSLQLSMLNLFHRAEALALSYRGEKEFQALSISGGLPSPFGIPLDASASGTMEIREKSYGSLSGELMFLAELGHMLQGGTAFSARELTVIDAPASRTFGADIILRRRPEPEKAGARSSGFSLRTGSSFTDQGTGLLPRARAEAAGSLLIPLRSTPFSLAEAFSAKALRVGADDSLHGSEKFRIGGNNSLRGYAQDQFAVCAAGFLQTEGRWYFGAAGHLFLFADGGGILTDERNWSAEEAIGLFGYGAGLRIPVRIGTFSLAYARNWREGRSPGRIHAGITNDIAAAVSSILR